ncbi:MAG TPA: serine hydrolase domain-containing protein [Pirellulales bacterium]|nr:serine hydrolase domain-containing protein [Pirellulales bacterium]
MFARPATPSIVTAMACLLLAGRLATAADRPRLPSASPASVGMSPERLEEVDEVVAKALVAGQMPGCVVLVARQGKTVLLRAYGHRSLEPEKTPMTVDTLFDLASLTKPVAAATSVMLLAEDGKLCLDDPVAKHLPEFAANGKQAITIRQLLTHQGGLIADNDISDYAVSREEAITRLLATRPRSSPGESFVYSDVGFLILGLLVERVAGESLDRFVASRVFQPLGLEEMGYLPSVELSRRAAPTEKRNGHWMQGEVHDPRAFALGGIAGHAGLFSTAEDLAVYAQMVCNRGNYDGKQILKPETVAEMTRPQQTAGGIRALGWDMRTGYSSNRGQGFSDRALGHGGFTGTSLWIDPELELIVIFLSNRVHPDGKGSVNQLAGRIGTIAAKAISAGD